MSKIGSWQAELLKAELLKDYCPQNNNWILALNYQEIVRHSKQKVQRVYENNKVAPCEHPDDLDFGTTPRHIYFNWMTGERLVALLLTESNHLVLIDNSCQIEVPEDDDEGDGAQVNDDGEMIQLGNELSLPKVVGIESTLTYLNSFGDLSNRELFSGKFQKTVGIHQWWNKCIELKQNRPKSGKELGLPLRLLTAESNSHRRSIIGNYVKEKKGVLNFSGVNSLDNEKLKTIFAPDRTRDTSESESGGDPLLAAIVQVTFDQNCNLTDFSWLKGMINLKVIEVKQCQQIDNQLFGELVKNVPNLEVISLEYCSSVNLRVLLPLLNLTRLRLIRIDYPNFGCQPSNKEVYVSREEWSNHHSLSLEQIHINSTNMTTDVLDYLLKSCPNLKAIHLSEETLKEVIKNAVYDGTNQREEDSLTFHEMENPQKGLKTSKPIRFRNMAKDNLVMPFSKSMLAKIKAEGGIVALPSEFQ